VSERRRPRVAVLGGGITGLAAAWYLRDTADVTVLEGSDRLGGKIRTERFAGLDLDVGPDSFLARVPYAADLCRELGLGDDLVAPATGKAYLWTRGRLRPFPEGLVLGVPSRIGPLVRSGIVSKRGVARAALDAVLPNRWRTDDRTITDVVGGRFGNEVVDRLVDPLLGGIHAGRSDRLSLATNAPDVASAARGGSLAKGLRQHLAGAGKPGGPIFLTLRQGLGALVERLEKELRAHGVDIWRETPVTWLERDDDGRYRIGPDVVADAVIVALPAPAAARVLERGRADVAAALGGVNHASVVTVTMAFPKMALDGSGFLVPRVDGHLLTACTWLSSKWAHLDAGPHTLLRASAGRFGDERALHLDDDALVERVLGELRDAMGLEHDPIESRVDRWHDAFPQYEVGHAERVMRIEAALHDLPGVVVAGAPYRGIGIASCIQQGAQAAAEVGKIVS
jgi:oxygen-dependent protoporphyrinogen oxidase